MDCTRSGVTVYEKSEAPAVCTLDGILSCSTAPGTGAVVVVSAGAGASAAGAGAGAAGAAVLRAGAAPPDTLAGALRGGGATGVVAMTWISGSFAALELEASWAATVPGAIASAVESAQSDPHNSKTRRRCRRFNDTNYPPQHVQSLMQALSNGVMELTLAIGKFFQRAPGTCGKSIGNIWQAV